MNVKGFEKKEKNTAELIVEISAEEFETALDAAYKKNRGQISVPGFRKGKAPRKIIENMYGKTVFYEEAVDVIVPSACSYGVQENDLRTVGYPTISDIDIAEDKNVTVTYTVALYPEVEIKDYMGVSAVKPTPTVEDTEIDADIAGTRLRNARIEATNRPAIQGDITTINFEGFVDGKPFEGGTAENYELTLGSNSFIPGFEEKMNGMVIGEERDLDLVFPENYKEDLAGKPVVFKVKLNELKTKVLPELDDEFAKDVSEFDTFEEYKESVRKKLLADKETEAQAQFRNNVLDAVVEKMTADIPDAMVEEYLDNSIENFGYNLSNYGMVINTYLNMMGSTPEAFRESMRPSSESQVKRMLALEKIAQLEKIEVTEEELEEAYKTTAERYGVDVETAKQAVSAEAIRRENELTKAEELVISAAKATKEAAEKPEKKAAAKKEDAEEKPAAKKAPAKKAAAKTEDAAAEKKPAAKKQPKADAEEKPAAKKTPAKKPAAKKEEKE